MGSRSIGFLVPGRIDERTGGYIYDRRIVDGLRVRAWGVDVRELDGAYPFPDEPARTAAGRALASFTDGTIVLVDSLALGALPDLVVREGTRLRIVALMHLPLAADVALAPERAAALLADERRALAAATLVVVTGCATIELLEPHSVPSDKIAVVEPGTDPAPLARGSGSGPLCLLSVATLNSGKGYDVLFRALASLGDRAWRLVCVGSAVRYGATAVGLRELLIELGLEHRVELTGELDGAGVACAYDAADLFVTATRRETYGMAVAEALARGLPVVGTRTGAIAALVGEDAGLVVPAGDEGALSAALARAMDDADLRARLAAGARSVRDRLPTWEQATGRMDAVLGTLVPR
jgi:glycosyltransferase involved in cell wall biosynthesis